MKLSRVFVRSWRFIDLFEKVNLKKVQAKLVEGKLTFTLKLDGEKANVAAGKVHRHNSKIDKDCFSFNEKTDVLSFQPRLESLPLELGKVQKMFEGVVEN